MKILEENYKQGAFKLQVETVDDLWVLYNVLREGDVVYSKTTREVKVGDQSAGRRLPMTLGIRVKRVEFQQFSSKLRVGGIIIEGPEEYGIKGKHHTLSIGSGDIITIVKERWDDFELRLIRDFTRRRGTILIVSIDFDEACIGVLGEQGVKYIWEGTLNLPSKIYQVDYENMLKEFINEVVKSITESLKDEEIKVVIIAGPGEVKNRVKSYIVDKVNIPVYIDTTTTGGCQGIREVLNRDVVKNVIGELNIIKARSILEEFRKLIVKDAEMVSYGIREVYELSLMGAVEKLLVLDKLLRLPDDNERNMVFEMLRNAYKQKAEVIIIPSDSDLGVELESFGGVIAILRYKLYKPRVDSSQ